MSLAAAQWSLGGLLLLSGWWLPRLAAGTRWRFSPALPIDLLLPGTVFGLLLLASARPVVAGSVTLALGAGWARADADKRRVLAEPIVFTDLFQALDILRHPNLALPFPHKLRIVLAAGTVLAGFALIAAGEPAVATPAAVLPALLALWVAAGFALSWLVRHPSRIRLTAEPVRDAAAHGALATILLHGCLAWQQRTARRRALPPPAAPGRGAHAGAGSAQAPGPVVLVQNESFFDLRRLQPGLLPQLLPHFDRCCRDGVQWGRLMVPSWGANTVRTEFAVLSGLGEAALGFDRFNPYHRFVSAPIASLAWTLRAEGYRTVCLHPFDRRFYRRDAVMPLLGFDEFLGEELFEGAERINGYVADAEVARVATQLLQARGPKLFLFIITMENHGPWPEASPAYRDGFEALPVTVAEQLALSHYAGSLRNADAMLGTLRAALEAGTEPAVLGFYGDHLPSFPGVYRALGLSDPHSDYLIWRSGGGGACQQDLAAEALASALLAARL